MAAAHLDFSAQLRPTIRSIHTCLSQLFEMIVHVYNPERILSSHTPCKSAVLQQQQDTKPPPSPKLLRQSVFKGFSKTENKCVVKKLNKWREKEGMDQEWPSSGGLPAMTTPQACTCHCAEQPVSPASREQQQLHHQTSPSHYFTPANSFNSSSQHDDAKEPDSLEYKPVRDSPPVRKASLERILSPQVNRRVYTSSPANGTAVPLSTSMSNASIQSNYSEDSLTHQCTPVAQQRWNSGHWIAETSVEKRPVGVLDFSKDSLNTPPIEDDEDSVKLEPLAFTIDFGQAKKTPKRFAERLVGKRQSAGKAEAKKSESGETESTKMLKSLSSRLNPLTKFATASSVEETPKRAINTNTITKSKNGSTNSSRHSSIGRNNDYIKAQKQQQPPPPQRSPSPPASPAKSSSSNHHQQYNSIDYCGSVPKEEEEEFDDVASETGTYTIGKDSPSPEEDQSRRDIDRVFDVCTPADDRSTPQWIREWAAQVAQQQETPLSKPPSHPARPPPPELPTRPRRRLPSVPPGNASSRSRSSPRPSDMSDPSDSSLETESFLRDTESVVSAMQARVDGRSSTESEAETRSSSSYRQQSLQSVPAENSIGRKLSAQLRAKIRSLDDQYPASSTPPSTIRKTSYVVSNAIPAVMTTSAPSIIHNELHGDDAKSLHSDSSLSDITSGETSSRSRHDEHKTQQSNVPAVRYNRALSLRRGRLGLDAEPSPPIAAAMPSKERRRPNNTSPSRVPAVPAPPLTRKLSSVSTHSTASAGTTRTPPAPSFSRNDGGRFSLRVGSKTTTPSSSSRPKVSKSQSGNLQPPQATPPPPPPAGPRKSRSNSTLTSKEAEFQNWKRRKNYDPMKAAKEGKQKEAARRAQTTTLTMSQSMIGTVTSSMVSSPSSQSPSPPPRTIIRSASFTCVNNSKLRSSAAEAAEQQAKFNNNSRRAPHHKQVPMHTSLYSSDDENEMLYSPPKKASPKPSPLTARKYMGLNLMQTSSPPSLPADFSDLASVTSNDVDLTSSPGSPRRKIYMEDGLLMRTSASNSSLRARTKLEALDNLVISTIYGMSSKIRTNAESLLRKLRPQYGDDAERLGVIDDTLNRLAECVTESPIHSVTAGRSSSRELSGTLKVMKRVEQVFQALDQLLFEEVLDGGGEEGAILDGGTTTEGEDWNGYTSGDFY